MSSHIQFERRDRSGSITLNAAPLNVLGTAEVRELIGAFEALRDCAVITLQASGERAFCAGMQIADHTPERAPDMLDAFAQLAHAMHACDAALIAKIDAPAIGGGFELALLCDFIVASERASFSLPEITLAALPPVACELLPRVVGKQRAADLILTGRVLDAQSAERWGIVSYLVPQDQLDDTARSLRDRLLAYSDDALRCGKHAIRLRSMREAFHIYTSDLLQTRDAAEGIAAFLQRRAPQWTWSLQTEEFSR